MDVAQSLRCAGRGVNRKQKAACMAFLVSPLLGSNALRKRICEFVLAKKEVLEEAAMCSARYCEHSLYWEKYGHNILRTNLDQISRLLLGQKVLSASYVFAEHMEGIEFKFEGGNRVVLSGIANYLDSQRMSLMWVRPSLATLHGFRILTVDLVGLVNPFVTDGDAQEDSLGMPYVTETMHVLRLTSDCKVVFVGGGAFCAGCGEGCPVYSMVLVASVGAEFTRPPRVPFGYFDHFNDRILDEFGSKLFATEIELSRLLGRYPFDESCSSDLHTLFHRFSRCFRSYRQDSGHAIGLLFVGGQSSALPGKKIEVPVARPYFEAYCSHACTTCLDCAWSTTDLTAENVLAQPLDGVSWIFVQNPSVEDFEAVLKFASSCTLLLPLQRMLICTLDVPPDMRQCLVRALKEYPSGVDIFENDSEFLFGQQSCIVGLGYNHLIAQREMPKLGACGDISDVDVQPQYEKCTTATSEIDANAGVEVAAAVDPDEAASVVETLWASFIERRCSGMNTLLSESLHFAPLRLLTFSRHAHELDETILNCKVAVEFREEGVDMQPSWANGAKIMVSDVGPERFDIELCPRHVVVSEADQPRIMDALLSLSYNVRPRLKLGTGSAAVPCEFSLMQDASVALDGSSLESLTDFADVSDGILEPSALAEMDAIDFGVMDLSVHNTFIDVRSPPGSPRSVKTI